MVIPTPGSHHAASACGCAACGAPIAAGVHARVRMCHARCCVVTWHGRPWHARRGEPCAGCVCAGIAARALPLPRGSTVQARRVVRRRPTCPQNVRVRVAGVAFLVTCCVLLCTAGARGVLHTCHGSCGVPWLLCCPHTCAMRCCAPCLPPPPGLSEFDMVVIGGGSGGLACGREVRTP